MQLCHVVRVCRCHCSYPKQFHTWVLYSRSTAWNKQVASFASREQMEIGTSFTQRFILEAHCRLVTNTNHANKSETKPNTKSQLSPPDKKRNKPVTPRDAHSNESDVSRHAGITSLRMLRSEVVILRMDCNVVLGSRKRGIRAFVRDRVFILPFCLSVCYLLRSTRELKPLRDQLHVAEPISRRSYPPFKEPECSLPYTLEPTTGTCPESRESTA